MSNNLVSIIIPAYNAEKHIEECIRGLIAQTHCNIEMIVVDDGSTDNTLTIVHDLASQDDRIRCITQKNAGASTARNMGLSNTNGEWIAFVDADDHVEPFHIERLLNGVNNGCDCAVCGYRQEYSNISFDRTPSSPCIINSVQAVEEMLRPDRFQGFLWNKLFSMKIVKKHGMKLDETLFYCEDLLFCAEYFSHCKHISLGSDISYHYRQHADSAVGMIGDTDEWLTRRKTAIYALQKTERFCRSKKALKLCKARQQTEGSEILRRLLVDANISCEAKELTRELRKGIPSVLFSPLPLKIKIKHSSIAMLPKYFSKYWLTRERRYY